MDDMRTAIVLGAVLLGVGLWLLLVDLPGLGALLVAAALALGFSTWRARETWQRATPLSGWTFTARDATFLPPSGFRTTPQRPALNVSRGRVAGRDVVAWEEREGWRRRWLFAVRLNHTPFPEVTSQGVHTGRVQQVLALRPDPLAWETKGSWLVHSRPSMTPTRFRSWVNAEGIHLARLAAALDDDAPRTVTAPQWTPLVPRPRPHHGTEDTAEPPAQTWEQASFDMRSTIQDPRG